MARRAKPNGDDTGVSAIRGNGYDSEQVQSFVDRVENLEGEVEVIMENARDECEPIKADVKAVKDEAKSAGIPKKELNAILSKRKKLRAVEKIRAKLSPTEQDNFDQLEKSLGMFGDTPLGRAVLDQAREQLHA